MEKTKSKYPRVLVISHNVFSKETNMGQTLRAFFCNWDKECLAQLYFRPEIPNDDVCLKYYRYTDKDAIKSIVKRWHKGSSFNEQDVSYNMKTKASCFDDSAASKAYKIGRKRTAFIYSSRDTIWRVSAWHNKDLMKWVKEFDPEIIFLASGDYSFGYRIAYKLSKELDIPLVTSCFDDFYLFDINGRSLLGKIRHPLFMNVVKRTISRSSLVITFNDLMKEDYDRLFSRDCLLLLNPSTSKNICKNPSDRSKTLAFVGNINLGRYKQLIAIGRALKRIDNDDIPKFIDVYSAENSEEILKDMIMDNGILFHGKIPYEEVQELIASSGLLVHTESFDEEIRRRVKYSFSTKIAGYLASVTPILAYGPSETASINYLKKNEAAFVATSTEELEETIVRAFTSTADRERVVANAQRLCEKNHNAEKNQELLLNALKAVVEEWSHK